MPPTFGATHPRGRKYDARLDVFASTSLYWSHCDPHSVRPASWLQCGMADARRLAGACYWTVTQFVFRQFRSLYYDSYRPYFRLAPTSRIRFPVSAGNMDANSRGFHTEEIWRPD